MYLDYTIHKHLLLCQYLHKWLRYADLYKFDTDPSSEITIIIKLTSNVGEALWALNYPVIFFLCVDKCSRYGVLKTSAWFLLTSFSRSRDDLEEYSRQCWTAGDQGYQPAQLTLLLLRLIMWHTYIHTPTITMQHFTLTTTFCIDCSMSAMKFVLILHCVLCYLPECL